MTTATNILTSPKRSIPTVILGALALAGSVRPLSPTPVQTATGDRTADVFVVRSVNVIPMNVQGVLRDQTVVVRDGAIVALGPDASISVPRGAQRIDGRGRYLIPGLFDMHVHLSEEEARQHLKLYLANGVLTIQSMHGSPWHLELRRRLRDGELIGPRMFTTGPTTATVGMTTPKEAREIVRDQKAAGYDALKHYGSGRGPIRRETYAALIQAAHQHGMRVVGHAPRNLPFTAVLEEGQHSIDHMEEVVYTSRAIGQLFQPYLDVQFGRAQPEDHAELLDSLPDNEILQPALQRLARQVEQAGLAVTPTLVAFGMIQAVTTDRIYELMEAPEIQYISPVTRMRWRPGLNRYRTGGWADKLGLMSKILQRSHELQIRLAGALYEAGVPIMAGTDAPLVYVFPGTSLHQELELLVQAGLPPFEALRAGTTTPAGFLGIDDEVGTIAVGKRAELLLLEGDPLADITATRRIAGVMSGGEWYSRERLDGMLVEIETGYRSLAERIAPLATALDEGRVEEALKRYRTLGDDELASFVESAVNSVGYRHLRAGDTEAALDIFRLNTEYFPDAFNTWDSLAEAYMVRGDDRRAIQYYEKSLALNPGNTNARQMIEKIKKRQ